MSNPDISLDAVAIAIVGSGGAGAITAGGLLLEAASAAGWYGLMTRSVGPQIRGGEALAMVRLAPASVVTHGDHFDVLLALDWHNVDRFIDEVPLNEHSLILADAEAGEAPAVILASGAQLQALPLTYLADDISGGRANVVALGALAHLLGLPLEHLVTAAGRMLTRKGLDSDRLRAMLQAGHAAATCVDPLPGAQPA